MKWFPTHFYYFEVLRINLFLTECILNITKTHLTITLYMTSVIYQKFQYIYTPVICVLNNIFRCPMTVFKDRNIKYLLMTLLKVFYIVVYASINMSQHNGMDYIKINRTSVNSLQSEYNFGVGILIELLQSDNLSL
jgi:hypothetical protein